MEFILTLIYIYLCIYTLYFFVLTIRNFKDKPFYIEKKYSKYDNSKKNFAVVIYSHNHIDCLNSLVNSFKMQDYPLSNFKIYAVLDNCNDGSEKLYTNDNFVHVMNIQDVGTLGRTQAISMLLSELKKDTSIDAYIFIDDTRGIGADFLTLANVALQRSNVVAGEVNVNRTNLDIVDKIKAVQKKYIANVFKQARSLLGLATQIDSGLLILKKEVLENLDSVNINDINSTLEFSLLLTQRGNKCVYNPNIQSYVLGQDCSFKNPKISNRFNLLKTNFKQLNTINFVFLEQVCSLLNPNFWTIVLAYAILIYYTYNCQFIVRCNFVIFSAGLLFAIFCTSLINAKLSNKEILMLLFYPLYSIAHIIKNLPIVRYLLKKIGANTDKEVDKLSLDIKIQTKNGDRNAKLEFINTESGLCKVRYIRQKGKYTTGSHMRMVDALQQLKSIMADHEQTLKICNCCKYFTPKVDGTQNMLKGECHNDFPSPLLNEQRTTQIWNTCNYFEATNINNIIEEIANEVDRTNKL